MSNSIKNEHTDKLVKALLSIKTAEEMYSFLEDLCTIAEIQSMSQRLMIAELLDKDIPYNDIVKITGVSTATISRVNRALERTDTKPCLKTFKKTGKQHNGEGFL